MAEEKWFDRLPGEDKRFEEMMERYLREHSAVNKAPKSHKRDKSLTAHLSRHFGGMRLTKISSRHIADYKEVRRKEDVSPKTINNELVLMGHAFNLAMKEWEWVASNPVGRVSKMKVNNNRERWLTLEEEDRLLVVSPPWLREVIIFALNTGLRRGEILNLRWPLVDLRRRTLTILEQKNKGKDTLPLNAQVMEILKEKGKVRSIKCDHVFLSEVGTPFDADNVTAAFIRLRKKVGLDDVRFHDLRHTFATRLVQAGVDIYKVQKLMRHKTPLMTQRYAHHYPESLRDGVEVLDALHKDRVTIWSQSGEKQEKGATAVAVTP